MDCPNCTRSFHLQPSYVDVSAHSQPTGRSYVLFQICPSCKNRLLYLKENSDQKAIQTFLQSEGRELDKFGILIHPKKKCKPLSNDIPPEYQKDFNEALDVLEISPKASAALSRYCLQRLLVEKGGVTKRDLYDQIQEVLDSNQLPSHLSTDIDAIRAIGNFGAHPIKSTSSGSIVEVEAGESQ